MADPDDAFAWGWWEYCYRRAFGVPFRGNYVDIVTPSQEAFMLMVIYLYATGLEITAVSVASLSSVCLIYYSFFSFIQNDDNIRRYKCLKLALKKIYAENDRY